MNRLAVLGATGSIGSSCLSIVRAHPDKFKITALTCASNVHAMAKLIEEFSPELAVVMDEKAAETLACLLGSHGKSTQILHGQDGFCQAATLPSVDTVLLAMVGAAGLAPALSAIEARKKIALANKETLVMAGEIVMETARKCGVDILPVDSEHSAIYQCLAGNRTSHVKQIFLTASGGPFRDTPAEDFSDITLEQALCHPNWQMGKKITIDSATLMNKGLEIIEAVHLFGIPMEMIQVLVHPQSIVHSMVGFCDGSIIAQMGKPDMKQAIAHAIAHPQRIELAEDFPDFASMQGLDFAKPDTQKFPCLVLARQACKKGGTLPAVMNAANEIAVQAFLEQTIQFIDIPRIISQVMDAHKTVPKPELSHILQADAWARQEALSRIGAL